MSRMCETYWGSHGCDLPYDHDVTLAHVCSATTWPVTITESIADDGREPCGSPLWALLYGPDDTDSVVRWPHWGFRTNTADGMRTFRMDDEPTITTERTGTRG